MSGRPWTPGPWEYDGWGVKIADAAPDARDGERVLSLIRAKNTPRTYGYGCGGDFVADLNDGEYHEYTDKAEQDANGKLIALAPEMAAALLSLEDYHDCPAAVTEDAARSVYEVVEKLRAIGGET